MPGRRALPPLLLAAGIVAGLAAAVLEPNLYRAETALVIERGGKPVPGDAALARQFAELAKSDVVVRNAGDALGTPVHRSRLHARAHNGVVEVSYDAASRVEAVRVTQQLAVDFSRLAASRFAGSGDSVAVFDPPHDAGRSSRHAVRDIGTGAAAGLVAAVLAVLVGPRRRPARGLRERGRWRVSALAELVERSAARYPDRVDDWRAYIGVLHGQADGDLLPYALDGLVREVFAPLVPPNS